MEQALQWWYRRQSNQMDFLAEKIRDGLLQESFTVRRSLELSLLGREKISDNTYEDWLSKWENFHHSLVQLSDRLSPPYLEEGLPLAIQYLLELWQKKNERIEFAVKSPLTWYSRSLERERLILTILDELLSITISELITPISIQVVLTRQEYLNDLMVEITYPNEVRLLETLNLEELENLRQTFQLLTSGQYFCQHQELTITWHLCWRN
jgi:hypothetical protein